MAEFEGGKGGKARAKKIDEQVSAAVNGSGGSRSSSDYTPPKKKPEYKASESEKKARTYGAPIQPPLTRMREGQTTDSNNKY
jgi:hypothetical protein